MSFSPVECDWCYTHGIVSTPVVKGQMYGGAKLTCSPSRSCLRLTDGRARDSVGQTPKSFDRSGVGTGYDGNSRAEGHVAEHTEDCWDVGSGAGAGGLPVAGLPAVTGTPSGIARVTGFSLDIPPSLLLLATAGPLTKPPIGGPQ